MTGSKRQLDLIDLMMILLNNLRSRSEIGNQKDTAGGMHEFFIRVLDIGAIGTPDLKEVAT